MARRQVTYLEVGDGGLRQARPTTVLDLDGGARRRAGELPPLRPERRPCPPWLAHLALVAMIAVGGLVSEATTSPDEEAAAERARARRSHIAPDGEPAAAQAGGGSG